MTNIFDNFDVDDIERSVADDGEQTDGTVRIIADVNVDRKSQTVNGLVKGESLNALESTLNTTTEVQNDNYHTVELSLDYESMKGDTNRTSKLKHYKDKNEKHVVHQCKSENLETDSNTDSLESSNISIANEDSVNTNEDVQGHTYHKDQLSMDFKSMTGDMNETDELKYLNDASSVAEQQFENPDTESSTDDLASSNVSSTTLFHCDSTAELIKQLSDSDSICSFNSYLDGEIRFYQGLRPSLDLGSRKRSRSTTPLTLTVSLGDTAEDEMKQKFADIC